MQAKMKIRCGDLANEPFLHTVLFLCLSIKDRQLIFRIAETEIVSGTDVQPGYEVSVLLGDWGSFTNKQFRAGITWALLAK